MDFSTFKTRCKAALPVGIILNNPGGGTSEVVSYRPEHVTYRRGTSRMQGPLVDFFDAYLKYSG